MRPFPRGRAPLGAAFGASLALNLAPGELLVAGPGRAPHGGGAGGGRGFDRMVARIVRASPEADRPAFRAVRREVDAAMARELFGPVSLRAAVAARSGRQSASSAASADTTARAMATVPPQGRARVAAAGRRDG